MRLDGGGSGSDAGKAHRPRHITISLERNAIASEPERQRRQRLPPVIYTLLAAGTRIRASPSIPAKLLGHE